MHIFFWWDYYLKDFFFRGCNITSVIVLIVTCFGLLCLSLFFEWLKMLQAKVRQKRILMTQKQLRSICPGESDTLLTNNPEPSTSTDIPKPPPFILTRKDRILHFVYDIGLWVTQNILGYILMLAIMIYNGYIVIGIVVGSALGYFLFGPTLIRINIENCRAMRGTFCMADCGEPDKTALLGSNAIENQSAGETSPVCHQVIVATTGMDRTIGTTGPSTTSAIIAETV